MRNRSEGTSKATASQTKTPPAPLVRRITGARFDQLSRVGSVDLHNQTSREPTPPINRQPFQSAIARHSPQGLTHSPHPAKVHQ
jgi:hypothetical protein